MSLSGVRKAVRFSVSSLWVPLLATFTVIACAPIGGLDSNSTRLFQIPWPDSNGKYSLQKVEIKSFDEPTSLHGYYANILVDPYEKDGQLESSTPSGRFARTKDGVMVPSDYVSLMATSIQAHMERLHAMNLNVGVSDDQVHWPAKIGVEANVVSQGKRNVVRNNAIFEKRLNALLMVPYSDSSLPIGLNAGILAHEHFHRIFQSLLLDRLTEVPLEEKDSIQIYNDTLLRAMNEGFADFWGWVYTGDENFIAQSLPKENARRSLSTKASRLPTIDDLKLRLTNPVYKDEDARIGLAYEKGTLYARLLHDLALSQASSKNLTLEDRLSIAKVLVASLPMLGDQALSAQNAHIELSPDAIIKPLTLHLPSRDLETCRILARVQSIEASITAAVSSDQPETGCGK